MIMMMIVMKNYKIIHMIFDPMIIGDIDHIYMMIIYICSYIYDDVQG